MAWQVTFKTIGDFVRHGANIQFECACDHKGVVDAKKLDRWFSAHGWNGAREVIGGHMKCMRCGNRPGYHRATPAPPDRPDWMEHEWQWEALVKRLRNW